VKVVEESLQRARPIVAVAVLEETALADKVAVAEHPPDCVVDSEELLDSAAAVEDRSAAAAVAAKDVSTTVAQLVCWEE